MRELFLWTLGGSKIPFSVTRGANTQVFPVFCDCPAGHLEAMFFFEKSRYLLVVERVRWIFLSNNFTYQVHYDRRRKHGMVIPSDAGSEEEFHLKDAKGSLHIFIRRNTARRRFVNTNIIGDVSQVQRPKITNTLLKKIRLEIDDRF